MFDLAIDSTQHSCEVIKLKISDVFAGGVIRNRATVIRQKTGKPVQSELGKDIRGSLLAGLVTPLRQSDYALCHFGLECE